MKRHLPAFMAILLAAIIFPSIAFADIAPIPEISCKECAEECVGCCGEASTLKNDARCLNCDELGCDYDALCKDFKCPNAEAPTGSGSSSCSALPLSQGTQNWSLLFILMAAVSAACVGAAYRLNKKQK